MKYCKRNSQFALQNVNIFYNYAKKEQLQQTVHMISTSEGHSKRIELVQQEPLWTTTKRRKKDDGIDFFFYFTLKFFIYFYACGIISTKLTFLSLSHSTFFLPLSLFLSLFLTFLHRFHSLMITLVFPHQNGYPYRVHSSSIPFL